MPEADQQHGGVALAITVVLGRPNQLLDLPLRQVFPWARMLRHATGFVLANRGTDTRTLQAYLGHRSIQSTVRYTELAPSRFKNLWRS
jgi:integrase